MEETIVLVLTISLIIFCIAVVAISILRSYTDKFKDVDLDDRGKQVRCNIRHEISQMYTKNYKTKTLTKFESEKLDSLVDRYFQTDNNEFTLKLYNEMRRWKVIDDE